jgi:hypothetical protein
LLTVSDNTVKEAATAVIGDNKLKFIAMTPTIKMTLTIFFIFLKLIIDNKITLYENIISYITH